MAHDHTYQYVRAVIGVRDKAVTVVTRHGEIIHTGPFTISTTLR